MKSWLARLAETGVEVIISGVKTKILDSVVARSQSAEGRKQALALIKRSGLPIYGVEPGAPDVIVERRRDGSIRRGLMKNGQFVPAAE